MNDPKAFLLAQGLTVLQRGIAPQDALPLIDAAFRGGVRIFEITFNPSDPDTCEKTARVIRAVHDRYGDEVLVGAGTVLYPEYARAAKDAGGEFAFSPNVDTEVIAETKKLGMLSIPGAFTPSECMQAWRAGADLVKLFPITVNDIGYLKNIMAPLSHIPFITTGGVNPDTIEAFFEAGVAGVGTGASIFKKELVAAKDYDAITALAKTHVDIVRACREKYAGRSR